MTSEREAYVYIQLPGTLETVPAALLRVQTLSDGTQIGRFRYGERYLQRQEAVALDPFQLPPAKTAATQAIEEGRPVAAQLLEQLDPGTSMGGARPKATIGNAQSLWLGKFPARDDRFNLQRIEFATLDLARRCSLNATQARLETVGASNVLMVPRFDRDYTDKGYLCLGLVSGLTVLGCGFRRMVFNAAVSNNDDHPRNQALLQRQKGWRLSPAYDLVPAPVVSLERRGLALSVGNYGRTAGIYNLLSQAGRFGLSAEDARAQIDRLVDVVRHWRDSFFACGVSAKDIDYIAPAILPDCFFFERRPDA